MSLNIDLSAVTESNQEDYETGVSDQPQTLALSLESVQPELIGEFTRNAFLTEDVLRAGNIMMGLGFATESVINARLLSESARPVMKTVVRDGQLVDRVVCPDGYRVDDGRCVKMSQQDAIAYAKRARRAAKTRQSRRGNIALTNKRRSRSMLIRSKNESRVNRVRTV